jgi:hypothetical protein
MTSIVDKCSHLRKYQTPGSLLPSRCLFLTSIYSRNCALRCSSLDGACFCTFAGVGAAVVGTWAARARDPTRLCRFQHNRPQVHHRRRVAHFRRSQPKLPCSTWQRYVTSCNYGNGESLSRKDQSLAINRAKRCLPIRPHQTEWPRCPWTAIMTSFCFSLTELIDIGECSDIAGGGRAE